MNIYTCVCTHIHSYTIYPSIPIIVLYIYIYIYIYITIHIGYIYIYLYTALLKYSELFTLYYNTCIYIYLDSYSFLCCVSCEIIIKCV